MSEEDSAEQNQDIDADADESDGGSAQTIATQIISDGWYVVQCAEQQSIVQYSIVHYSTLYYTTVQYSIV